MKKIKQLYLKEAINIRLKYHELIKKNDIVTEQLKLEYNKLSDLKLQLNKISDKGDLKDKQELYELMFNYEQTINGIEQFTKPILKEIDDLNNRSKVLYQKIITDYPGNTEEEIKEQLFKQLEQHGIN